VYTLPRFGCQRATASRATAGALSVPGAERATLCACSALWSSHGRPSSVLAQKPFKKLKNPFLFFIRFQAEFKLQKFVSKYPELQKL
jgi:hypothetical protein